MTTERITTEIAVIGAGVVGLSIAHRLLAEGRDVVLVDPNPPGSGASFGNAGTIADYAVMPVGTPEVLRNLPSLLINRNSPLSVRRAALPGLMPWLARFARQSLPGPSARNAVVLARLLAGAGPSWERLAAEVGGSAILQRRGCLYLYDTPRAFRAAGAEMARLRGYGVAVDMVGPQDLSALEPGLAQIDGGAAFFPNAVFLSDPAAMMRHLAGAVGAGARFLPCAAQTLTRRYDGVLVEGPRLHLHARKVVIAAGAHSKPLARAAGDRVPLDTERGYHVEWDMAAPRLNRPVCPTSRGFYLCPMTGRLRVAGTVELGGLTAPPSAHRIQRLIDGARAIFPDLGKPDRTWMGFRPSMPDSLPVIGPSALGADVIHAFGHGHIGLTLAPVTARIVTDLVMGRAPEMDITALRAGRF